MNIYYYLFVVLLHTLLHSAVDCSHTLHKHCATKSHACSGITVPGLLSLWFLYVQTTCPQLSQTPTGHPAVLQSRNKELPFLSLFCLFVFLTSGLTLFFLNWNKAMNWKPSDLEMLCDWSNAFSAAAFEASRVARRFLHCSAVQDVRHSRAESCLSFCQLEDWCEWGEDRDPGHWPKCICSQGDHFMKEKR